MPRDDREQRLDEEVRFHLEMATERNIRLGMSPEEARRRAQLEFGAREHWKDEARDEFRRPFFGDLRKDFGHAIRALRRHPGFALTVILTLMLGIGASTAIFSVFNSVLLRPLPYADLGRLALLWGDMRDCTFSDCRWPMRAGWPSSDATCGRGSSANYPSRRARPGISRNPAPRSRASPRSP